MRFGLHLPDLCEQTNAPYRSDKKGQDPPPEEARASTSSMPKRGNAQPHLDWIALVATKPTDEMGWIDSLVGPYQQIDKHRHSHTDKQAGNADLPHGE